MRRTIGQRGCAIARHAANTGLIADGWYSVDQAISCHVRPVAIVSKVLVAPTPRSYAGISSQTARISRDPTLLDLMQDFAEASLSAVTDALICHIMYRRAGVEGMASGSRDHDAPRARQPGHDRRASGGGGGRAGRRRTAVARPERPAAPDRRPRAERDAARPSCRRAEGQALFDLFLPQDGYAGLHQVGLRRTGGAAGAGEDPDRGDRGQPRCDGADRKVREEVRAGIPAGVGRGPHGGRGLWRVGAEVDVRQDVYGDGAVVSWWGRTGRSRRCGGR